MEGIIGAVSTGPAIGAVATIALISTAIAIVARLIVSRRPASDPLSNLFDRDSFGDQMEATLAQVENAYSRGSILRGRVDHLQQVDQIWGRQTRDEAIAQVAQVMRAGVRRTDVISSVSGGVRGPERDGSFVIMAPGANEGEASGIARRLLNSLGRNGVRGMGEGMRITASFGVAERRVGESEEDLRARADAALSAAQDEGEDRVITASEWEEIKLLPAPAAPEPRKGSSKAA